MLNSSCDAVCSFHLKNDKDHDNADFESDNHKPNLNNVPLTNDDFNSEPNLRDDTANMNSENLNSESLNNPNLNNDNPTLTLKHHNPNLSNDNPIVTSEHNNPNLNNDNPTLTLKHNDPNLNNDNQSLEFEMCRRGCRSAGIKFLEAAREFAVSNVR